MTYALLHCSPLSCEYLVNSVEINRLPPIWTLDRDQNELAPRLHPAAAGATLTTVVLSRYSAWWLLAASYSAWRCTHSLNWRCFNDESL